MNYILSNIFLFLLPRQYKLTQKVFTPTVLITGRQDFTSHMVLNSTNTSLIPAAKAYFFIMWALVKFWKCNKLFLQQKIKSKYNTLIEFPWKQLNIKTLIFPHSNFIISKWVHFQVCKYVTEDIVKYFWNSNIDILNLFFSLL